MRRRAFIIGGAITAWPLTARAQRPAKMPTIGYFGAQTPESQSQWKAAFVKRLDELGWIEGRTVTIEYRWAEGQGARYAEITSEFARLKVDVIVTNGTATVLAARKATSTIPIVFASAGDPVGTGLVASLARPGGNVTGLSSQATDTAGKRLGLLREIVPGLRRLAILANAESPVNKLEVEEVRTGARALSLATETLSVRRADDIAPALEELKGRADALHICFDPLLSSNAIRINTLAIEGRLPTTAGLRELVERGSLMSYAANFPEQWRSAAGYVDKILRGAKPQDMPVAQPTKFDLVINLKTAKAIGIEVPPILLARADEVIE